MKKGPAALVALSFLVLACGDGQHGSPAADAELIEFALDTLRGTSLTTSIELTSSDLDLDLFGVADGRILADTGIVLVNAGDHEVIQVGRDGDIVWRFGREGDGPGEFRYLTSIVSVDDDAVEVFDSRLARATRIDGAGLVGTRRPWDGAIPPGMRFLGVIGGAAVSVDGSIGIPASALSPGNTHRDSISFFAASPGNDEPQAFLHLEGPLLTVDADASGTTLEYPKLRPAYDVGAEGVYFLASDSMVLSVSDASGRVQDLVRFSPVPEPPEESIRRTMMVGSDGSIWLSGLRGDPSDEIVEWIVLAPESMAVSTLRLPRNVGLLDYRFCRLLVGVRSELGEETIQLLRVDGRLINC